MTTKPQFDALLGGNVEAPIEVDPMKFATARAQEIAAISQALGMIFFDIVLQTSLALFFLFAFKYFFIIPEDTNKGKLIFQRLPRHMRRRVMGHNAKRMPRNLREAYTQQVCITNLTVFVVMLDVMPLAKWHNI